MCFNWFINITQIQAILLHANFQTREILGYFAPFSPCVYFSKRQIWSVRFLPRDRPSPLVTAPRPGGRLGCKRVEPVASDCFELSGGLPIANMDDIEIEKSVAEMEAELEEAWCRCRAAPYGSTARDRAIHDIDELDSTLKARRHIAERGDYNDDDASTEDEVTAQEGNAKVAEARFGAKLREIERRFRFHRHLNRMTDLAGLGDPPKGQIPAVTNLSDMAFRMMRLLEDEMDARHTRTHRRASLLVGRLDRWLARRCGSRNAS